MQLLTLSATWIVTDQGEALLTARRFLDHGSWTLADSGESRLPEAPWAPVVRGQPVKSRLLPGVPVLLIPLLALDRALGLAQGDDGRLVHLQGPLGLLLGLALLARALSRRGVSDPAAATALLVVGLCWPLWFVAHRGGPEPVLAALACAFFALPESRSGLPGRALCLGVMPWFNPSGSVLAAALLVGTWLEDSGSGLRDRFRKLWPEATGLGLGQVSTLLLWNLGYHGHWLEGGYHLVHGRSSFGAIPWSTGLSRYCVDLVQLAPVLLALSLLPRFFGRASKPASRVGDRELLQGARVDLLVPLLVLGAHLAFFATYEFQEPARRLAPALACFGLAAGRGAERVSPRLRVAVCGLALAVGTWHFLQVEGRYYEGPDGLFYPSVLWVKRLIDHGPSLSTLLPPLLLLSLFLLLLARLSSSLLQSPASFDPPASASSARP